MKKFLCLTLCLALALCLGACGKGEGKENDKQSSGDIGDGFGGRTVVISGTAGPDEESETYAEEIAFQKELEEKYNCKIEYDVPTDWAAYQSEILTKALGGQKIGDVFIATGVDIFPKWALNELVAPLDEYFDFSAEMWNQDYNEMMTYNGQHYGISNWTPTIGNVILFNKRLCASYGISDTMLYELQANKQWNWSKFLELAKKCTKVGNSENNSTWGFAWDGHYSATYFIYSNGDVPVLREGNMYKYNLNSAKCIEGIQFASDLLHKHKVVPDSTATSGGTALWKKGKVAFFSTAMWAFPSYVDVLKNDEIGVLLSPIGNGATDYVNVTDTPSYIFMQPMVEDKDLVAKLVTDLYTPQEWQAHYDGYDTADAYEDYFFDDESAETLRLIEGKTIVDAGGYSTDFRSQIYWGDYGITAGTDPRTWADSNAATGQYYLDSVWSQEFSVTQDA